VLSAVVASVDARCARSAALVSRLAQPGIFSTYLLELEAEDEDEDAAGHVFLQAGKFSTSCFILYMYPYLHAFVLLDTRLFVRS
jgi:hypothetical protein